MAAKTKHVDHSKKSDGSHDQSKVIAAAKEAVALMETGQLTVTPVFQLQVAPGKTIKIFLTDE